jgi:hypothetical protein
MEVSGQLHVLADLPPPPQGKHPLVLTGKEAGWASEETQEMNTASPVTLLALLTASFVIKLCSTSQCGFLCCDTELVSHI